MKINNNFYVSSKLTKGGLVNPYNIIFYKELNIIKDYEKSSFNTRIFS